MEKKKLLIVTSELNPFVALTELAQKVTELPNLFASNKMDVRILLPRFGTINERRNRLHEVVRLSGINVMFNDEDFALTVKVASLPDSKYRLQAYFLHNEDFFNRKFDYNDADGKFYDDNSERMVFFNRGVMETLKKFGWAPDYILCNGWFTSLVPMYARTLYANDPVFTESKIIVNLHDDAFEGNMEDAFLEKALLDKTIDAKKATEFKDGNYEAIINGALRYADRVVNSRADVSEEFNATLAQLNKPVFHLSDYEDYKKELVDFVQESKGTLQGA